MIGRCKKQPVHVKLGLGQGRRGRLNLKSWEKGVLKKSTRPLTLPGEGHVVGKQQKVTKN